MQLIICQNRLNKSGGELRLVNVASKSIKNFFDILDLGKVLTIEYV